MLDTEATAPAARRRARPDPVLAGMLVAAAALYAWWSLRLHAHWVSGGFDLGIFDQVVWHYSRFEAPASSIKDLTSIWGDHLSPVMALFAPGYWLADDARTLLVGQALLVALGAIPVFLATQDLLGRGPARALTGAYLAFWGVASAISFDVHEVAWAPLALGTTLLAARRRAWRWYWPAVLLTLCVKEDLSFVVVFLGASVALGGDRRIGALTAAAGIAWYVLATEVVIPHYGSGFSYWSYDAFGSGPLDALKGVAERPWRLVTVPLDDGTKAKTLALLLGPFLGLCLLSREALLLIPLFGERFLSSTTNYWGTSAHYSLSVAVVLVIGTAAGLAFLRDRVPPARRRALVGGAAAAVLALNLGVATQFPLLEHLLDGDVPGALEDRAAAGRAVAAVPVSGSVAAPDVLIARLTHRDVAAEIGPATGQTDHVVADLLGRRLRGLPINDGLGTLGRFLDARVLTHVPVFYEDGWITLRARTLPPRPRPAALAPMSRADQRLLEPAVAAWGATVTARRQRLEACLATGAPCPATGTRSDAALQAVLSELGPRLSPGCHQLGARAATAIRGQGALLDPALTTDGARLTAGLGAAQDTDADGFLLRFVVLCTPRFA